MIKHYCDVCKKEKQLHQLTKFFLSPFPGDFHNGYEADVCWDCKEAVLKPFKQLRTTLHVVIDFPEEKKARKKGTKEAKC